MVTTTREPRPRAHGARTARPARLTAAALALLVPYGAVRLYWLLGHPPGRMSPIGGDLVAFTGWGALALCGTAALTLVALRATRPARMNGPAGRALRAAGWAAGGALVASGALLLLDVVGGILPGLGIRFFPYGALSRAVCVGAGVLTVLAARAHRPPGRGHCCACGRDASSPGALTRVPAWAYAAAYASVAGCLVRIAAQAAVGFDASPLAAGPSVVLFEAGFVLGGSLLPLSQVHRWGRTWPGWVPRLAGRRVPRPLVLWPAAGVSGGLVVYFGLMQLQMIWERLTGRDPFPPEGGLDLPETFFWFAVPGYLVWGIGLAVASAAYARRTRTPCPACRR
ncbi:MULTISPECIES: hypothetical protein [Actinomadura]|uniref:Uncharacterized protein n=1 Tax=Actinomadura yumaensis TaxID=111807 RepID=A0ABW2CGY1_9ACTN|nr:hypothetical protein [Actinomadura sp. J1-007]MWK40112.1 hypothetical protein [Actinomadura sp. J1-007]